MVAGGVGVKHLILKNFNLFGSCINSRLFRWFPILENQMLYPYDGDDIQMGRDNSNDRKIHHSV